MSGQSLVDGPNRKLCLDAGPGVAGHYDSPGFDSWILFLGKDGNQPLSDTARTFNSGTIGDRSIHQVAQGLSGLDC